MKISIILSYCTVYVIVRVVIERIDRSYKLYRHSVDWKFNIFLSWQSDGHLMMRSWVRIHARSNMKNTHFKHIKRLDSMNIPYEYSQIVLWSFLTLLLLPCSQNGNYVACISAKWFSLYIIEPIFIVCYVCYQVDTSRRLIYQPN